MKLGSFVGPHNRDRAGRQAQHAERENADGHEHFYQRKAGTGRERAPEKRQPVFFATRFVHGMLTLPIALTTTCFVTPLFETVIVVAFAVPVVEKTGSPPDGAVNVVPG